MSFRAAHAGAADWREAVGKCLAELGELTPAHRLGFLYVSDPWAAAYGEIAEHLTRATGIRDWIGTVGLGICGSGIEYFDQPAMSVMVADLPADSYRLFAPVTDDLSDFRRDQTDWIRRHGAGFAVVHADPRNPRLQQIVDGLAGETGFLVGGLSSSRGAYGQLAGTVSENGVSGALFAGAVTVATGLTQGCSPIGPVRTVTECIDNVAISLDDRPALEVFKEDIGELLARDLRRVAGYIFAAIPVTGSDTGDYLVRNLVGIDPEKGWLAVAEQLRLGTRVMFCRRDRASAEQDLTRMLDDLKRRTGGPPKGALYVSCLARGPNLFGSDSEELKQVKESLGDVPLVGFFANGEISHDRLYAYTGVLTLFL